MARKKAPKADKAKALDRALKGMFGKLERRPVPGDIMNVVDQLDEAEKEPSKKARAG
jgi:hypothetical protein